MESPSDLLEDVCAERESVDSTTLEKVVTLAVELAREGREGRKIGTIFTVGDAEAVLAHSQPMILDPMAGHDASVRHVDDPNVWETLKELALLDAACVISDEGIAVSAARHLDANASGLHLPPRSRESAPCRRGHYPGDPGGGGSRQPERNRAHH